MAHFIPSAGVRPRGSYNSTKGPTRLAGGSAELAGGGLCAFRHPGRLFVCFGFEFFNPQVDLVPA
jgi:hypothetical protein